MRKSGRRRGRQDPKRKGFSTKRQESQASRIASATPAYSIPLLHTWSLAIEEQFYIFLPLFILLVYRLWPSRLRLLLAGAALISFLLSARGAYVDEEATFYLLHTAAGSC